MFHREFRSACRRAAATSRSSLFALAALVTLTPALPAQNAHVGDSLITAPRQAYLPAQLRQQDIDKALRKVADWQLGYAQPYFDQDWTFAALYAGFMAVPDSVNGSAYRDAMLAVGKKFAWQPGPRLAHADDHAIGQTYLELYKRYKDPAMMAPIDARMQEVMKLPDNAAKPLWWWCDALFMAPPVLADLAEVKRDPRYLDYMDRQWWMTTSMLYDREHHLYFRDASFLHKTEKNGQPIFWSRGNGWVMAGLVRVLSTMPKKYPARAKYVQLLEEMAESVSSLQGRDGLWRPGLLDAKAYPLPEVSGSAFFTYALAYGIRTHLLDRKKYLPVVEKSWAGLLKHVYEDGRLGSIQPIGAAPGEYTESSSYVFGVGAFLLAGSELHALAGH